LSFLGNAKHYISPLFAWWPEYKKSKIGIIGLVIMIVMVALVLLAPAIAPYDPRETWVGPSFGAPSPQHLLGTTSVGEDVLSQMLWSGRVSLMIGFSAAALIISAGTILGLLSGYFGGIIDELVMRIADILLILPRLPLLIVLAAYLEPGPPTVILMLATTGWAGIARQVRAQTLSVKQFTYVEASKSVGASHLRIIVQHVLPNVAGIVIAAFAMEVVVAILVESGLAFLGLLDPTKPSWGMMLYFAQNESAFQWGAWWWFMPPGLSIALVGLAFAYIGNTLNDRFVLRLKVTRSQK